MSNEFTKAQRRAIETLDKSILVSAAAGAGKTTVLINRIIGIILGGHANVDEMLVVTFTNAAASEMRLRLASAIRKRIREHPEDAARMKEQLSRLHRSYISTIDSFAQRVVREFFYEIDMEPEFSICDEVQGELMKREAVSEMLEEAFEDDSMIEGGSFREFMRLYSDERSDETFTANLIKSYDQIRTMPDYFEWAYNKAEELKADPGSFRKSGIYEAVLADAKHVFSEACSGCRRIRDMMDDAGLSDLFERKLTAESEGINNAALLLESSGVSDEFFAAASSIERARLIPNAGEKEAYEPVKAEIKAIREAYKKDIDSLITRYAEPDFESCIEEMNETYGYTLYYLRLLEEFERRYSDKKKEKRLMDFSDVTHAAVRILKNDDAAETLRKRFRFVFVDEYQDTNNLQEYLIGKVSGPRNVFKVGDVKQSIYKFRLAEPEIFERLYREYSDPACTDGELINLSDNFRTNDGTIRYINHVFENLMEGYDEETRLHTGIKCPDEYDFRPEVHVLLKENMDEDEPEGDDIEELSNDEAECAYIAELAAGIIGTEFYDAKKGAVRKAEPRDIAILMRSVKYSGELIASALAAKSVDAHIDETDDYFDTMEINVAMSLFMTIDNLKRDVPLIASLHSEVFSFTPEELAAVRIAYKEQADSFRDPYHMAFSWYVCDGPEGELKEKCRDACDRISEWRRLSRMMPLSDFIWKVLTDSGYYKITGAMNSGSRRQANLRALADRAAAFSRDNVASLSSFINFVEVMKSRQLSNGQPPMAGKEDNLVRISTMHKSKGLEFPFVIVGGLGRRFNRDNREKKFSFDSAIGVGMPYIDPDRKYWRSGIALNAIKQKSDRDSYKEELRLLYVDMTRARNKLHLVGAVKDMESLMKYGKPDSYLKVLKDYIMTPYNEYHILPIPKTADAEKKKEKGFPQSDKELGPEAKAYYDEVERRLEFEYPDKDKLHSKTKYSVSAIRREELKAEAGEDGTETDTEIVNLHARSEKKKKASAADVGIAYHRIMEFIDFEKAAGGGSIDSDYIRERAGYLRDNNAIEEDVYKELDLGRIEEFFRTDIGKRALTAARSGRLYKEKAFTLKTERAGREILVQGVIDCCFEENGRMTLVDYKSSYIRKNRPREEELERIRNEYKVQLELYSEAVKKGTGLDVNAAYLYLFATGERIEV